MTTVRLESPASEDEIYLARGPDVPLWRPVATGDVFTGVPLTLGDEPGDTAIVLTHPCSMRKDGVHLADRILVAPVREGREIPLPAWSGHFRVLPLPSLRDGRHCVAAFAEMEPVDSVALDTTNRIAALHPSGVNLLLQRLVHHMSRVVVETERFNVACAGPFAELDIVEDWIEAAVDAGMDEAQAAVACHEWLRAAGPDGVPPQERLIDAQQRAAVRRNARLACRRWIDTANV